MRKTPLKKYRATLLIILFLSACESSQNKPEIECGSEICVTDFAGHIVELDKPAETIIAMAPHAVENVFTAGAGEKLVGVVDYSNYPEAATKLPVVVGYQTINFERIIELNPDLIIAWESGNSHAAVTRLKGLGFKVYLDEPASVNDIAKSLRDIGTLTGTSSIAEAAAAKFLSGVDSVLLEYANVDPVTVFYQVWNSPLQTINGDHIISDAIEACGGVNIYADEFAVAPVINIESVLEQDPAAVIAGGTGEGRPAWLDEWQQWPDMTAVKNRHLFHVNPDHTQRHTIRLLLGISQICAQLEQVRSLEKAS